MKHYETTFRSKKIYPLTLVDVELDLWTTALLWSNGEAATLHGKGNKAQV